MQAKPDVNEVGTDRGRFGPRERVVLVLMLGIGVWLRVYGIASHELWLDEYGTWWAVAAADLAGTWQRAVDVQGQSPLWFLLTRPLVEAFGPDPLVLRAPALLCGLLVLAAAWPLAMAIFRDRRVALMCVAATAVSEPLINFSQDARPYSLAILGAMLSMTGFALWLRQGRRAAAALWVGGTAVAWYAHYLFGMIVLVQACSWLASRPWRAGRGRSGLVTFGILGAILAPGLLQLGALFGRRSQLDWVSSGHGPFADALELGFDYLRPGTLVLAVVAASLIAARSGIPRHAQADARPGLVAWWFILPLCIYALLPGTVGVNLIQWRYASYLLPAAALIVASILAIPRTGRLVDWLPLILFLMATSWTSIIPAYRDTGAVFSFREVEQRWEQAAGSLVEAWRPGDLVLHRSGYVELDAITAGESTEEVAAFAAWPLVAHLPDPGQVAHKPLPWSLEGMQAIGWTFPAAAGDYRRVWIIGTEQVVDVAVRAAGREPGCRIESDERFGKVRLVLAERERP